MSRREANKRRTRRAIAEAALALFAEHGFEATSVDAIAEAASVSRRTVFRYFPRKEDTAFPDHEDRLDRIAARMAGPGSGPQSVREALHELGRELMASRELVMTQQAVIDASPTLTAADRLRDRQLEDAVAAALGDDGDAVLLAGAVMGAVRAVVRAWFASGCDFDLVERADAVFHLLRWPAE